MKDGAVVLEQVSREEAIGDLADWCGDVRLRAVTRRRQSLPFSTGAWRWWVLATVLALHVVVFVALRDSVRKPTQPDEISMLVELVTPPRDVPVPQPAAQRADHSASPIRAAPITRMPAAAPTLARPSAPPDVPMLFNRDGSLNVPTSKPLTTKFDDGIARGRELLARGHNSLHCRHGGFDDGLTPAEAAGDAARSSRTARLVTGDPLDPLLNVGAAQADDAAADRAATLREIEQHICDD
jgi:hypothetical protein